MHGHNRLGELTQRVTAAQLRFLLVLALELVADRVEQLDVALVRVLAQRRDEGPRHGARGFAANRRVGARLRVLGPGPHDDIGGRRFGPQVLLIHVVAGRDFLEERGGSRKHAADVVARVGRDDAEEALAGFFGEVGLLEDALRGVDVGQVESRA